MTQKISFRSVRSDSAKAYDNFSRDVMDVRRHLKQRHATATCEGIRLLTSSSELLQSTFKESCVIANHKRMSWVACVEFLLKQIGVSTSEAYLPS